MTINFLPFILILVISLTASFLLAIIPSNIAKRKGYSAAGFYWFGVGALVPAIIVACCLRDRTVQTYRGPYQQPPQDTPRV